MWLIETHGAYKDELGFGEKRLKTLYFQLSGRSSGNPGVEPEILLAGTTLLQTFFFDNLPVS